MGETPTNSGATAPTKQIGSLARLVLEARFSAFPQDTRKTLDTIEKYADVDISLPIALPGRKLPAFVDTFKSRSKGENIPDTVCAHISGEGMTIKEGVIIINKRMMPASKWQGIISEDIVGQPVSSIIDLGPSHASVIRTVGIKDDGQNDTAILRYDHDPLPWEEFQTNMIARFHSEDAETHREKTHDEDIRIGSKPDRNAHLPWER